jgi:YVTN family beta-propeller protein
VVYAGGEGRVLVANGNSMNVSVISDSSDSVMSTVSVGSVPMSLAYDTSNGHVYLSNNGQGTVSVISLSGSAQPAALPSTLALIIIVVGVVVAAVAVELNRKADREDEKTRLAARSRMVGEQQAPGKAVASPPVRPVARPQPATSPPTVQPAPKPEPPAVQPSEAEQCALPYGVTEIPCPKCQTLAEEGTKVCEVCGYPLEDLWKSVAKQTDQ